MTDTEKKDYKKSISIIKNILKKKKINDYNENRLKKELKKVLSVSELDYKLCILCGKSQLVFGNNKEAIEYFNQAISLNQNGMSKAAYYGLFKAYINLFNYQSALKCLEIYDSYFKENFNMSLYFKVLNMLLDLQGLKKETKYSYCNTNGYINCVKCPVEGYDYYVEAEHYFDRGNYFKCLENLIDFQEICEEKNYSIDITHLIKMMKKLYYILKNSPYNYNLEIENKLKSLKSVLDKKEYLRSEVNNNSKNVYALVRLLKILVDEKNYDEAYRLLNHKMDNKEKEKYIKELNDFRKTVYEQVDFAKNKTEIDRYLNEAEIKIQEKNYAEAFKIYKKGYESLSCAIFLFKNAELNYLIGDLKTSKKYFYKYLDNGEMFKTESYIYLDYIFLIENKKSDCTKYSLYVDNYLDLEKYMSVYKRAEDGYFSYIHNNEEYITFEDNGFNGYFIEIMRSIKKGKTFRIEAINKNNLTPKEFALVKIYAAPYILEQGVQFLADSYYENALNFSDDEMISTLAKQYREQRWGK